MAYYDIQGYDDDDLLGEELDILGAARRPARPALPAPRRAPSPGVRAVARPPTQSRRLVAGVDSGAGTVAALGTAVITVQVPEAFRPEALSVDPACAPGYLINSILIGRKNQLLGAMPVPASSFSATAPLAMVQWDTIQANQTIVFNVTNQTAAVLRFNATLFGTSVE